MRISPICKNSEKNRFSLIFYLFKEEGVSGDRFSGGAAVSGGEDLGHPGRFPAAPADLEQRSDDGPDHVPQKPVCTDFKDQVIVFPAGVAQLRDMGRDIGFPSRVPDLAEGGFVGPADLLETGEIPPSEQVLAGLVHRIDIQRIAAAVGVFFEEGIPLPVQEILVAALHSVEAGVEIRGRHCYAVYGDPAGQHGI